MHQQNNPNFIQLLRWTRIKKLTYSNIVMLNGKVMITLTLNDLQKNIVIIQCNKTRYLINCF